MECPICHKKFHLKQYRVDKINNPCCSMECSIELRQINMSGEGNHQYGLIGELNSSL